MRFNIVVFLFLAAACDKRRGAPQTQEAPAPAESAITIANVFGTCDDLAVCETECDAGAADRCRRAGTTLQFGTKAVTKDDKRALAFYDRACALKSAAGCVSAGQMWEFHHGVEKDDRKAAALYKQACDLDDQVGCANYAIMLERGTGVPKDEAAATTLFDKACQRGAGLACDRLKVLRATQRDH
jgi:TPR repeat protein